uniref:Uncharacterized protein n=1 Tax=viral metagenome TaxID=1070528 RepID=A0A6M3LEB3_9ZZZZ
MKKEGFVECGCCGSYHQIDFHGDCRDDGNRFHFDELPEGADILTLEEQMEGKNE